MSTGLQGGKEEKLRDALSTCPTPGVLAAPPTGHPGWVVGSREMNSKQRGWASCACISQMCEVSPLYQPWRLENKVPVTPVFTDFTLRHGKLMEDQ